MTWAGFSAVVRNGDTNAGQLWHYARQPRDRRGESTLQQGQMEGKRYGDMARISPVNLISDLCSQEIMYENYIGGLMYELVSWSFTFY